MAEVRLFVTEFGETINNIKRLEEELKRLKQVYKDAAVGSDEFNRAQAAGKEVTAILKQQNDALKANTNALGGINSAAKFAEGTYGRLKQQIKENRDMLDKVTIGGKVYNALIAEGNRLQQERIKIEMSMPSLFQERIKGAIDQSKAISGLNMSMMQLTREMPAFANSVQTGFMAISNNLPMFFDSIKRIKDENKELASQGKATTSVFKSIVGSLVSVGSLLSIGVTLLTVLGPKLIDSIMQMANNSKKAEEITKKAIEGLKEQSELSVQRYENEIKLARATGLEVEHIEKKKAEYIELNILNQINTYKRLAKIKGELNEDELKEYQSLQKDLLNATVDRQVKELQNEQKLKQQLINLQNLEEKLRLAGLSDREKEIDAIKKQQEALTEELNKNHKVRLGNEMNDTIRYNQDVKKINEFTQNEIDKVNEKYAKQNSERKKKIKDDELKRQKELLDGIKRNQEEEISYLTSKIQERKNLEESSFEEQENLIKYQYEVAKYNADNNFEAMYAAKVAFDSSMLELENEFLDEQEKIRQQNLEAQRNYLKLVQEDKLIQAEILKNIDEVNYQDELDNLNEQFELKQEALLLQRDQELLGLEEFSQEYNNIVAKYKNEEYKLNEQFVEQKKKLDAQEIQSAFDTMQVITTLGELLATSGKQQTAFQKMSALATVAMNTGIAISNLVATSFSALSPDNIATGGVAAYAKLAAGLLAVTTNMAQAQQIINSFEEGGYTGEGNPHEVSTNLGSKSYTYHKDEYVIPSRVLNTPKGSALAGQLENMRLGMSNPMPHISGMFDGGFTGRSAGMETTNMLQNQIMMQKFIESMPNPVVRVTDINRTQGSVQRAVNVSSL